MKWLNKIIEKIGTDKALHFLVGALITSYAGMIDSICLWMSLFFVIIISFMKEFNDVLYDVKDIIAGITGSVISIIMYYIL